MIGKALREGVTKVKGMCEVLPCMASILVIPFQIRAPSD